MAIRASEDPEYKQSRAALRDLYGSRRIDARPHQSDADATPSGIAARASGIQDTTPSGIARELGRKERAKGATAAEAADTVDEQSFSKWRSVFKQPIPQDPSPMARMAPISSSSPPLDIMGQIRQARDWGAVNGTFQTPYGTAGFDLRPTTPPDENALTKQLSDIPLPKSFYGAQAPRPSILSSASKWLK